MLNQIPRFFRARTRTKVGMRQSYGVTTLGKTKAEEFSLSGPPWKVLAYLAEDGPSSVNEIERETGMSTEKVTLILKSLLNNGYVQTVTQTE